MFEFETSNYGGKTKILVNSKYISNVYPDGENETVILMNNGTGFCVCGKYKDVILTLLDPCKAIDSLSARADRLEKET